MTWTLLTVWAVAPVWRLLSGYVHNSECMFAWHRSSSLLEHDPGPQSTDCVLWYGMYAELPERVGRCLKERSSLPPTHWGYWGHKRRRRRRECFPPLTHPPSYLFTFPSSSFLSHSSRNTYERLFLLFFFFLPRFWRSSGSLLVSRPPFFFFFPPHSVALSDINPSTQVVVLVWTLPQCFSPGLHHDLCGFQWVWGLWHGSAASSLTSFVCKELSTCGRWGALSWLPSTNEPLLTWRLCMCVYLCLAVILFV